MIPLDYPAAHSMDSTWFAVDEDGHVAVFDTGEGGVAPTSDAFPMGGEAGGRNPLEPADVFLELIAARATTDAALAAVLAERDPWRASLEQGLWQLEDDEAADLAGWLGVFHYACVDQLAVPYTREVPVAAPVHLDALPPALAERLRRATLPLRFAATPVLAPGEHVEVVGWSQVWIDRHGCAHRTDGKPLRPEDGAATGPPQPPPIERPAATDAAMLELIRALVAIEPGAPAAPAPSGFMAWLSRLFGR